MQTTTKLDQLKTAFAAGDYHRAIKIAAYFPRLGEHKDAIKAAWAAIQNPDFYEQIGKNPTELIEQGKQALREKYGV